MNLTHPSRRLESSPKTSCDNIFWVHMSLADTTIISLRATPNNKINGTPTAQEPIRSVCDAKQCFTLVYKRFYNKFTKKLELKCTT